MTAVSLELKSSYTDRSSWVDRARCHQTVDVEPIMASAWTHAGGSGEREARRICTQQCPVRVECLVDALNDPTAQGIRAGFHFELGIVRSDEARRMRGEFGVSPVTTQKQNRERVLDSVEE